MGFAPTFVLGIARRKIVMAYAITGWLRSGCHAVRPYAVAVPMLALIVVGLWFRAGLSFSPSFDGPWSTEMRKQFQAALMSGLLTLEPMFLLYVCLVAAVALATTGSLSRACWITLPLLGLWVVGLGLLNGIVL